MNSSNIFYFDIHGHLPSVIPGFFKFISGIKFPKVSDAEVIRESNVNGYIISAVADFNKILKIPINSKLFTLYQLKLIKNFIKKNNFNIVYNADEFETYIKTNNKKEKIFILGIEGGDFIGNDLSMIEKVYNIGVRVITIVHFHNNTIGSICMQWGNKKREIQHYGLTTMGKELIKLMNTKGIIIDLAHSDSKTIKDVCSLTDKPVICSHTGVKALQNFPRYISDEDIKLIADTDGVLGLWPYYYKGFGIKTNEEFIAHAKYLKKLVGAKHISIGTDINAVPSYMENYTGLKDIDLIINLLKKANFTDSEIEEVCGYNFLRVFKKQK